jgi:hypothetical protein
MSWRISLAGRFAREAAAAGEGEVRATFRRSCYLRFPGGLYACVGDASLGRGPLNALADDFRLPAIGERVSLSVEQTWAPPTLGPHAMPDLRALRDAARGRTPAEGFGGLVLDAHNSLSGHAQPALDALEGWLVGNTLEPEAEMLIGLGPGLTPSGDDYLGGMLIALHQLQRGPQAAGLWRWLEPRLSRTSDISRAHLTAAAAGEGHEALHAVLGGDLALEKLDGVGHTSGWDALAGVVAVLRSQA